ncbi:MAG: ATP-binding cassette domain-containing protein, partial [Chloroflexi bacterium]|nr:ATP-binding cassette domain-containing protein [Chloroflexota bacterium]
MSIKRGVSQAADSEPKVVIRNLWKVFGPHAQRVLAALQSGDSKQQAALEGGHVIAVRDATFSVQPGEIFVIMGLSGSGKSTLVRCISRLIE